MVDQWRTRATEQYNTMHTKREAVMEALRRGNITPEEYFKAQTEQGKLELAQMERADPAFMTQWRSILDQRQQIEQATMEYAAQQQEQIDKEARDFGLTNDVYRRMLTDINNGEEYGNAAKEAQTSMRDIALNAGYSSLRDYYQSSDWRTEQSDIQNQQIRSQEVKYAQAIRDEMKVATDAGYYDYDGFWFQTHSYSNWGDYDPKQSPIYIAHTQYDMTLAQYMSYISDVASNVAPKEALETALGRFTPEEVRQQELSDYTYFEDTVAQAGKYMPAYSDYRSPKSQEEDVISPFPSSSLSSPEAKAV